MRRDADQIGRELDDILKITRDLSIDLSPPILQDEGLAHAIQWLAARMRRQYGLSITVQADGSFAIPNEELHVLLFNCVRELLFNVVKHAEAGQAVVALQWVEGGLKIKVEDNGKGFPMGPTDEPQAEKSLTPSLGLPTIRHQLNLFGGSLEIQTKPGEGTQVLLTVPISGRE
jgi:two-component system CheB/CheR fusion protein